MIRTKSGKEAHKLALGGAALGSCDEKIFFGKIISEDQAVETVLYALQNGINLIDTSPFYGNSEYKIGKALVEFEQRKNIILSTKTGTHPKFKGYDSDNIKRSVENSLKTLRTDYIDIVHIHDPQNEDLEIALAEGGGFEALLDLRYEGIIRYIGLGVRDHSLHRRFIESGYADIILPYLDYNLLDQTAKPLLDYAVQKKVDVMLGSPLCMGLLSGKDPRKHTISHFNIAQTISIEKAIEMYDYCVQNHINILSLNYKFILSHPAVTTVVTGPASIDELKENISAFDSVFNAKENEFLRFFDLENLLSSQLK